MNVKGRCTRIALQSSIEHQRSVTYLRPVCLQPDPKDGSFDYFSRGGSGHWAKYHSESSSDGIEVRGTSRKLLHAHGESPSAPWRSQQPRSSTRSSPSQHWHQRLSRSRFPREITPLASPLDDPAPNALHIPTLQAIHRMQQQASPAPAMMPTMPQTPTTQPQATLPRDPAEYTQAKFPTLTPRQLAVLAQLEMQDQQALRSSAHNILQPGVQTVAGGPAQSTGLGHTKPASTTSRPFNPTSIHTQHHEGPRPTIPQPQSAQSSSAPTQGPLGPKPPQP